MVKFCYAMNHELWRPCSKCGLDVDLRSYSYCPSCGSTLRLENRNKGVYN